MEMSKFLIVKISEEQTHIPIEYINAFVQVSHFEEFRDRFWFRFLSEKIPRASFLSDGDASVTSVRGKTKYVFDISVSFKFEYQGNKGKFKAKEVGIHMAVD